jgi:hypothetical protein
MALIRNARARGTAQAMRHTRPKSAVALIRTVASNQTMQGGKQRALLGSERPGRHLFDAAGHAEPVELASTERLEDQPIERSLQEVGASGHLHIVIRHENGVWAGSQSDVDRTRRASAEGRAECATTVNCCE